MEYANSKQYDHWHAFVCFYFVGSCLKLSFNMLSQCHSQKKKAFPIVRHVASFYHFYFVLQRFSLCPFIQNLDCCYFAVNSDQESTGAVHFFVDFKLTECCRFFCANSPGVKNYP